MEQENFLADKIENPTPEKRKKSSKGKKVKNVKTDILLENGIQVFGEDVPLPISAFSDSPTSIPSFLKKSMQLLSYENPTPVQMQAIPLLLNARHVVTCAQTGSGKTLAYLFPLLVQLSQRRINKLFALVILPTKELAAQIFNELSMLIQNSKIRAFKVSKLSKIKSKNMNAYHILVSTPQRLVELINDKLRLDLSSVKYLICDEGDLLLTEGKRGFKNQLAMIYNACPSSTVKSIFSATVGQDVEDWAALYLDRPVTVLIGANSAPETIHQELVFVGQNAGKILAVRNMVTAGLDPPVLVFTNTIEGARELFDELIYDGINVEVMHADKTEAQRTNIVTAFRTGRIWVLITTDLMARGIDFKGIKKVINFDVPNSAVNYIHRIGRTGRFGSSGSAITFYTEADIPKLKKILPVLKASNTPLPDFLASL